MNNSYKGSAEPAFRTGAQWPMADPVIVSLTQLSSITNTDLWSAYIGHGVSNEAFELRGDYVNVI